MVTKTTNLLYRFPDGGEQPLAPGTPIVDAYDKAVGELLILGAPGAGKSTLLLDLAQRLVDRALTDSSHPLPVVLQLSPWTREQPAFAKWMIEQLKQTYNVPLLLGERWVTQGYVLPLLDGLGGGTPRLHCCHQHLSSGTPRATRGLLTIHRV